MADETTKGQRWRKLDLHVHTPASRDYTGPDTTADDFVDEVVAKGVDGIAVTDHNSAGWIDDIRASAKSRGLAVFPGVEVTVTGGKEGSVHVIAIFDTHETGKTVENLLAKLDIPARSYGASEALSPKSPEDAIRIIRKAGALPVLAHADSSKGVLNDMKGQARKRVMNLVELAGVEVKDVEKFRKMLDGSDENYNRKLAVYRASDNRADDDSGHSVSGIARRFSYFKMDIIDLEALRQCFYDPDVRILTDLDVDERPITPGPWICSVEVSTGFLEGRYELHEALNCVIGGKGVGKSLLVELIRFALDQQSRVEAIEQDHKLKLERLLGEGGVVSVEFCTSGGRRLVVSRTYDATENPLELRDPTSGESLEGRIDEIFPIMAYSQTEAIEIARDAEAQLRLIDSMLDLAPARREIREVVRELEESDHDILEARAAGDALEQVKTDLATTEQKLDDVEKLLESKEYDEYKASEPRTKALEEMTSSYDALEEIIVDAVESHEALEAWSVPSELEKDDDLQQLNEDLSNQARGVLESLNQLSEDLRRSRGGLQAEKATWEKRVKELRSAYEEWATEAGGEHHELLEKRDRLKEDREALNKEADRLSDQADGLATAIEKREDLLDRLEAAREVVYNRRKEKYEEITSGTDGRLKLKIERGKNREAFSSKLIQMSQGSYARHEDIKRLVEHISPRKLFWYLFLEEGDSIRKSGKASKDLVARLLGAFADVSNEDILALQYDPLVEDVPNIQMLKDDGDYYGLDGLSVGQKCTALLMIALSDQERPILVDQPEDALDIASVYADVTAQIRRRKADRQFVLTTHNPTVAVAGDSDKFLILKASATRGEVATEGAIERKEVKKQVILHLEGGPEPYGLKSFKYGEGVE